MAVKKPEDQLNDLKAQWAEANARGDEAGKNAAHAAAEQLRKTMDQQNGTKSTYNAASGTWTTAPAAQRRVQGSQYDQSSMSASDNDLMSQFRQQYNDAKARGDNAGMSDAHAAAEALRKKYGYSGGGDGSYYILLDDLEEEKKPSYTSRFSGQQSTMLDDIINSTFQKWMTGDDYKYLMSRYTAGGKQAMQDTMGQAAARTGGYASSYATAAANQSYNDYMSRLEEAARAMYQDELDRKTTNYGLVNDAEQRDYSRYLDSLGQYNTDRSYNYNKFRDTIGDYQTKDNTQYERALQQAETLAQSGDFSGYRALGYSESQIAAMENEYKKQSALTDAENNKPRLTFNQALQLYESGNKQHGVLEALEYYLGSDYASYRTVGAASSSGGTKSTGSRKKSSTADVGTAYKQWADTLSGQDYAVAQTVMGKTLSAQWLDYVTNAVNTGRIKKSTGEKILNYLNGEWS